MSTHTSLTKINILILLNMLMVFSLAAQTISGKVTEWNEATKTETPVISVNIYWMNTTTGTTTDTDGNFQIGVPAVYPSNLIVSFIGYQNDTIRVMDASFRKILLRKSIELKEVEVAAKQNSTIISTINAFNTEKVTEKELLKAACCNLSESFETNPTVNVAYKDAVTGAKEIQLLGLGGIYSQLLTENIPNMRGITGIYGLTFIPGPWMEGIQITKGSGSVLNGYESTTGQINVEFKKPDDKKVPRFYLNLFGEENGNTEINTFLKKKMAEHWSTIFMVHGNYLNSASDRNDDGFYDVPLTKQINLYNRWQYHSENKIESQFGVKFLSDQRESGQLTPDPVSNLRFTSTILNQRFEVFGKLGIIYPEKPAKSFGNIFQATYHNLESAIGLKTYDARQKDFYYEGIYQNIIGTTDHQYKTGISFLYELIEDKYNLLPSRHEQVVPGIFGEYTYSYFEKLKLIGGIRGDYINSQKWILTPRIHGKYNFDDNFIFRFSGGKSVRVPNAIADNISVLASSKQLLFLEIVKPEEAWNYGINFTRRWEIGHHEGSLSIDFYRTDFMNQLVMDSYSDTASILFYNLSGKSYSNSFQVTFNQDLFENFGLRAAFKTDDVQTTYMGVTRQKPLVAKNRMLLNLFGATANQHWKFDYTVVREGKKRLANTATDAEFGKSASESPAFFVMHFQVTKIFKRFELYGGGENLLDYRQKHPIINSQNPFSSSFDATQVWGPIEGRRIYAGLRYSIQ